MAALISPTLLFWPAFAQVVLVLFVLVAMGRAKAQSLRVRGQQLDDVALNRAGDWDEQATKTSNNFRNLFEMPVLFFAAIGFALALKVVDPALVLFAWAFVFARGVQTAIHIGHNRVYPRFLAYLTGVVALIAMWIDLAIRVALS